MNTVSKQLSSLYPESEAGSLTKHLFCHVLQLKTHELLTRKDKQLSATEKERVAEIVNRLLDNEPLQYVLGETPFYGLSFKVTPQVLIPRPETEELVEWIIECERGKTSLRILDVGTGSGCIAVSLSKFLPSATVYGLDISEEALTISAENADRNAVTVNWMQADILKDLPAAVPSDLDILVSNPPYVTDREKEQMHANVVDYEPHLALFVPDERALLFYERIAEVGKEKLRPGGSLFFEINARFGQETVEMLRSKGYNTVELRKDIAGKDRMIRAV